MFSYFFVSTTGNAFIPSISKLGSRLSEDPGGCLLLNVCLVHSSLYYYTRLTERNHTPKYVASVSEFFWPERFR